MKVLALVYATFAALGTLLGIRREQAAAFFGLRTGRSAAFDAAIGFGTGISAPWTLVVPLVFFAFRSEPQSRQLVRLLSLMALLGQLGEPVTWRLTRCDPVVRALVAANVAVPIALYRSARNDFGTLGR